MQLDYSYYKHHVDLNLNGNKVIKKLWEKQKEKLRMK